jgi:hypothetical protein
MKEVQPLRVKHDKLKTQERGLFSADSHHRRSSEKLKHFCRVAKYFSGLILTEDF